MTPASLGAVAPKGGPTPTPILSRRLDRDYAQRVSQGCGTRTNGRLKTRAEGKGWHNAAVIWIDCPRDPGRLT